MKQIINERNYFIYGRAGKIVLRFFEGRDNFGRCQVYCAGFVINNDKIYAAVRPAIYDKVVCCIRQNIEDVLQQVGMKRVLSTW